MANYNYFANYSQPSRNNQEESDFEDVLKLYQMVESRNRLRQADIDDWGKDQEKWAIERGKVSSFADYSPILKARLAELDAQDLNALLWAYMNRSKMSKADREAFWNYKLQRDLNISDIESRVDLYLKDKEYRDALVSNAQNDYVIFKKDNLSLDDYFNGTPLKDTRTNISGIKLTADVALGTKAVLALLVTKDEFKEGTVGGKLIKLITSGNYDTLKLILAGMNSADPYERLVSTQIYKTFSNYMNSLRHDIGYAGYSSAGKTAIDNAIFRGIILGLTPVTVGYSTDPDYSQNFLRAERLAALKYSETHSRSRGGSIYHSDGSGSRGDSHSRGSSDHRGGRDSSGPATYTPGASTDTPSRSSSSTPPSTPPPGTPSGPTIYDGMGAASAAGSISPDGLFKVGTDGLWHKIH